MLSTMELTGSSPVSVNTSKVQPPRVHIEAHSLAVIMGSMYEIVISGISISLVQALDSTIEVAVICSVRIVREY
jgi:hypothetical protein